MIEEEEYEAINVRPAFVYVIISKSLISFLKIESGI